MGKLYILCGIPFSGKTTLAKQVVRKRRYTRIDLDDIKFEIYGNGIKDEELKQTDWDIVYQRMYKMIDDALIEGKTVIHDTGNFTKHERGLVKQIADKLNIDTIMIFVDTPSSVAYERLLKNRSANKRFDVSDNDFNETVKEMEPPTADENPLIFHYDEAVDSWIDKNLK